MKLSFMREADVVDSNNVPSPLDVDPPEKGSSFISTRFHGTKELAQSERHHPSAEGKRGS